MSRTILLANVFVLSSRFLGMARTVRLLGAMARALPLSPWPLDTLAGRIARHQRRFRRLLLAADQPCLGRTLVLYFYGARMGMAIRVIVGGRQEGGEIRWHCWLEEHGNLLYEPSSTRVQYTPVLAYAWGEGGEQS